MDEELRLFYVAVTRARDRLWIVYPRMTTRGFWGEPSRFLQNLPSKLFTKERSLP